MQKALRFAWRAAAALGFAGVLAPAGCRSATEVTVDVRTLAPALRCADLKHVSIVVATDPEAAELHLESGFLSAEVSGACDADDRVGTLVVTPNGSSGAIIVAAAVEANADCTRKGGYVGCIVARRVFSFVEHAAVRLPITLERSCLDVPCNVLSSCRAGECVSSDAVCSGSECVSAAEPQIGPNGQEVPPEAGAIVDAGPKDTGADAPPDANLDASVDADSGGDGSIGPHGTNYGNDCPVSSGPSNCAKQTMICCYSTFFQCTTPPACGGVHLPCMGRAGCGGIGSCCADIAPPVGAPSTTMCMPGCQAGLATICTTDDDCPEGEGCRAIYFNASNPAFQGGPMRKCAP